MRSAAEEAGDRGKRIIGALEAAGLAVGLRVALEYPVKGGRIDVVWLWDGGSTLPEALPLVAFEVESSWRTRKHIKGDYLNLIDLQPALGVIVLLGEGDKVESTRVFARQMVESRPGRIRVWSEDQVISLAQGELPTDIEESLGPAEPAERAAGEPSHHTGKYRDLAAWLVNQERATLELSFAEIEEVLGFPLPPSSRRHAAHWHSYEGSAVARAIQDAGWKSREVDLGRERLRLERVRGSRL